MDIDEVFNINNVLKIVFSHFYQNFRKFMRSFCNF
jgi:hypothetical protein